MENEKMISFTCTSCGKTLQVPAELEEFSCLYCGTRLSRKMPKSAPSPKAEEAMEALKRSLLPCITEHPGVFRILTRKDYGPHFESYVQQYRSLFERFPEALSDREDAARVLAEHLVEGISAWAKNSSQLDEAKYTMCLLFIPAVRSLGLEGVEEFCRVLHEAWMKKYPKRPFQAVTYREIDEGFQRKKLCFITTAVCHRQGKPDDCRELTAFRAFRDGYLKEQPDGDQLIRAYYDHAPGIVTAINYADDPNAVYPAIWEAHLAPCYEAILNGENARCKALYTEMVQTLARKYLGRELLQ